MISVCLASYNGEKYIKDQIISILKQLSDSDELVISDDGSIDNTLLIIKSLNDSRIKLYENTNQHGVNKNFENTLRRASGDYIFLADQDDVWINGKVEACLEALKVYDCVIHDAIVTNKDMAVISKSFFEERNSGKGFWKNIYKNTYLGCCMAFKRNLLEKILPIPSTKAYYHDNWIGCVADLKYQLAFIPFKGIFFRRHDSNTSCTAKTSKYNKIQQASNRLIQLYDIIKRLYL